MRPPREEPFRFLLDLDGTPVRVTLWKEYLRSLVATALLKPALHHDGNAYTVEILLPMKRWRCVFHPLPAGNFAGRAGTVDVEAATPESAKTLGAAALVEVFYDEDQAAGRVYGHLYARPVHRVEVELEELP